MPSLVDASIRVVNESVDSCEHCDSGNCNSCNGIIHGNTNCILLEGLSKAKNLALIADSKTVLDTFAFSLFISHSYPIIIKCTQTDFLMLQYCLEFLN